MKGYLGNRELSDAERRKLRPNPFFGPTDQSPYAIFTGDMGYLDEEGFLYLKGRRDDMVKIQGNRVYPQEVTAQILCVPGVRDSVVVSHTEDDGTISLTAFVVPIPEAKLTVGQLRRELNRRLPSYMVPNNVVFVHAIPRTATGKADVRRLSEARTAGEA
jgi:acyl-coenzyme A synthetase/AMP-(fatty) acid ligase